MKHVKLLIMSCSESGNNIEQFVDEVLNFSSQYGCQDSISYVASNIIGKPSVYPEYGDFSGAFGLRAYGHWWEKCPSALLYITEASSPLPCASDFIDITFEKSVYPIEMNIYETLNPGSVIRVWGCYNKQSWHLLWYGKPRKEAPVSRILCLSLKRVNFLMNLFRIELDCTVQDYYCSLDAILLKGTLLFRKNLNLLSALREHGLLALSVSEVSIMNSAKTLTPDNLKMFLAQKSNQSKNRNEVLPFCTSINKEDDNKNGGYFSFLPCCWWMVSNNSLNFLKSRATALQTLDLSWCGLYGFLEAEMFMEFIHSCGQQLTSLSLSNCEFVDNYCLYIIANVCLYLKEINLTQCCNIDHLGFGELKKLKSLNYINISLTRIDFMTLHILLQNTKYLKTLILHNCLHLDMDDVAVTLSTFNRSLISLGCWKSKGLTVRGLLSLSQITTLEDLDLGWALSGIVTEGLEEILKNCPNMTRFILTALRTLTDNDLYLIATYGIQLQQIDIMGTRNITEDAVYRLLECCPKLQLLDVSFCELIHSSHIARWSTQFPGVCIRGGNKK